MSAHASLWPEGEANTSDGWSRRRPRRWLLRSALAAVLAVILAGGTIGAAWGVIQYQGNFHAVAEGVLYRSSQLSKSEFAAAVRDYGVKSVLNLRGAHAGQAWYDNEVGAARELGLAHFDYGLSAKRFVSGTQIAEILELVRQAPKPLLIHCKSGSDRTGLVAALYRFSDSGATAKEADGELSLLYGHFPYLTSRSVAMDDSFWAYVRSRDPAPPK